MIMDYLYTKISTIFVLIYIFILFTFDFEDKIPHLIGMTILLIVILYYNRNKTIETMDNIQATSVSSEPVPPPPPPPPTDEESEMTNKEMEDTVNDLNDRIKILEEMVSLKEWSAAQSHEITELRNKLEMVKQKNEEEEIIQSTVSTMEPILTKQENISRSNPITPMGAFDGLCIDSMVKKTEYDLVKDNELNTYLGSTLPLILEKTEPVLNGPTIDGQEGSPKKLSMFGNNQSSISCCDKSPFFTSTGCVCITDNQEKYINSRGGNHILPEKAQCPL